MEFSQILNKVMEEQYITRYQLAKDLGVHPSTITNWLNGVKPRQSMLPRIAAALGVSTEYLQGTTDNPNPVIKITTKPDLEYAALREKYMSGQATPEEKEQYMKKMLAAFDKIKSAFLPAIELYSDLPEEDQRAAQKYIEFLAEKNKDGDPDE